MGLFASSVAALVLFTTSVEARDIDGSWSDWSSWTDCHGDCPGFGTQQRQRMCTNPSPEGDGNQCQGDFIIIRACQMTQCEAVTTESNWSEWTEWASCDMCTMRGLEERWRTCSYDDCEGDMLELRPTPESERVSMWSQWSEWASCDRCKTSDLEERVRSCVVGQCQGSPLELRYSLEETDQEVEAREQQSEDSDEESVWSEWSDWVQCDKCENEGIEERTRRCSSLDGCRGNPIELRFKNQPAPEENAYVIDPQSSNTERDLVYQQFDNHINMFYADTNSRPKQILASIKESSIEKDITKHEEEMASSDSFEVIEEVAYHHQPGVMARDDALSVKLKQILRRTPPLAARTQTRGETVLVVPHHHHTTNTSQTTDVVEFKTFYDHPNHIHKNQANSLSP